MIKNEYKSNISKDKILIKYFNKSHKCNLDILCMDDIYEGIKIVNDIIEKLKYLDVKWICIDIKKKPLSEYQYKNFEKFGNSNEFDKNFEYIKNLFEIVNDGKRKILYNLIMDLTDCNLTNSLFSSLKLICLEIDLDEKIGKKNSISSNPEIIVEKLDFEKLKDYNKN